MDLGIWIIISALVGAKLLLSHRRLPPVHRQPARPDRPRPIRRRLLRRADRRAWRSRSGTCGGHSMPLWTTTDVFAPGIALGHVVGRLGCLMAGCCFGRPTSVPWAITFHSDPAAAANVGTPLGVPLHPTQLYEAGAEAADPRRCCWRLERRGRPFPGRTFWTYMLLYGVSRFVIEILSRRQSRDGLRSAVDVAVRVGDPGPARDRDALPARRGVRSPSPLDAARSRRRRDAHRPAAATRRAPTTKARVSTPSWPRCCQIDRARRFRD